MGDKWFWICILGVVIAYSAENTLTAWIHRAGPIPVLIAVPTPPYSLGDVCSEAPVCRCGETL